MKILIINLGGSSSKLALFDDETPIKQESIRHEDDELKLYPSLWDQYDFRKDVIVEFCIRAGVDHRNLDAIVSRGPVVKPLSSGVYEINNSLVSDAKSGIYGVHPCGLGCEIAMDLGHKKTRRLTVDPPSVDEMITIAKYTGMPQLKRRSLFHALNHKAIGEKYACAQGSAYEELDLIICHLGSGISIATHQKGRVIDVTNGLDGDGPFGLDRVGTLPAADWMNLIVSEEFSQNELKRILNGNGGMKAYLGTNNAIEVERMIDEGSILAKEVYDAMIFQIAKGIGAACAILGNRPDAILLTGGMANSSYIEKSIQKYISWIGAVHMMPCEDEMLALFKKSYAAMNSKLEILRYEND